MKRDEYKMTQQVDTTNYKEKYEQALERAKKGECIENIFPELREFEDEKIRKGLIKGLSAMRDIHKHQTFSDDAINIDDAIAWLEKQGEQRSWSEEELTEFEEEILNLLNCATPEGHGAPTIEKTKEYSQKLLDLARKELEENYYTKVVDDRMVFKSELHATDLQTAYDMGKQDTLKSLPNWEKCDDNLPYSHIGGLNERYLIKNGYCIKISDLETLPKEK